jgi:5-methylcytosine-specific restriction endonuclease McrA
VRDAKPEPRIKDPALMRLLKIELDECEISGVTTRLHLHHIILRSHQGSDVRENIICLCDDLHRRYHEGDPLARRMIAEHVNTNRPDVACYIAETLGGADALLEWFERHGL